MTTAMFLKTVRAMQGFPMEMIQYLIDTANQFSAAQRKELVQKLQPLNKASEKLLQESIGIFEKAEKNINKLLKDELPKQRNAAEKAEKMKAMRNADTNLFS